MVFQVPSLLISAPMAVASVWGEGMIFQVPSDSGLGYPWVEHRWVIARIFFWRSCVRESFQKFIGKQRGPKLPSLYAGFEVFQNQSQ